MWDEWETEMVCVHMLGSETNEFLGMSPRAPRECS